MKAKDRAAGAFTFLLHGHLPYVLGHGTWPHGQVWLNEAAFGCYQPLAAMLRRRQAAGRSGGVTLGLTPVLCEQLSDRRFEAGYDGYLAEMERFARDDERYLRESGDPAGAALAAGWLRRARGQREEFAALAGGDLAAEIGRAASGGAVELIAGPATHPYLPLLGEDAAAHANAAIGAAAFERRFGFRSAGAWLPECAYRPAGRWIPPAGSRREPRHRAGVEEILLRAGFAYTLVEPHLIGATVAISPYHGRVRRDLPPTGRTVPVEDSAQGREPASPYRAYEVAGTGGVGSGLCVLVRDPVTSLQVWSGEVGYPADARYLEFHKRRFPGGLRYWSVTHPRADLADKKPYEPAAARAASAEQATHFAGLVVSTLERHRHETGTPGILVAPYDAELFGHWWSEGLWWLEEVLERLEADPRVRLTTCGTHLAESGPSGTARLREGSWGEGGDHRVWLNPDTEAMWSDVYRAERVWVGLESRSHRGGGPAREVLDQLQRSLLLLEASDWPFLITTGHARDYAEARFTLHHDDVLRLGQFAEGLLGGKAPLEEEMRLLSTLRERDALFTSEDLLEGRRAASVAARGNAAAGGCGPPLARC